MIWNSVRRNFPQTLLLAREPIGWGTTADILTDSTLARARTMPEAWDEHAPWHCHWPFARPRSIGMMAYDVFVAPFTEFAFMRRALVGRDRCWR